MQSMSTDGCAIGISLVLLNLEARTHYYYWGCCVFAAVEEDADDVDDDGSGG